MSRFTTLRLASASVLIAFLVMAIFGHLAIAGPLEDATAAYARNDYATALRLLRPLADAGNARAQYALGWYYDRGMGVPQDYVQAHMWFNLSAANETDPDRRAAAIILRDDLASKMTPAQIADAQKLAREWVGSHPAQ